MMPQEGKVYNITSLDEYTLLNMILLFLSENTLATSRLRSKVCSFYQKIDTQMYESDPDVSPQLVCYLDLLGLFVRESEEGSAAFSVNALRSVAVQDTRWGGEFANFFANVQTGTPLILYNREGVSGEISPILGDEAIHWLDRYLETELRYMFIYDYEDMFHRMSSLLTDGLYDNEKRDVVQGTMQRLEGFMREAKAAEAVSGFRLHDFVTDSPHFISSLRDTHRRRSMPQSMIRSGLRRLNQTLGGGFQSGRVYTILGRSGDWKSGLLLNIALWACSRRYNDRFLLKDPTRRPCVLYLTQENDRDETIERFYSYQEGVQQSLGSSTVEHLEDSMMSLFDKTRSHCQIAFRFRPDRTIDTGDLSSMVKELYLEGYEVVMVVQDYIKRIRPVETFRDARHLELGQVVNDLSTLAKEHQVPVITAMQLNRAGYEKIRQAQEHGGMESLAKVGASDIGESINIWENSDVILLIGRTVSRMLGDRQFLEISRAKMRGRSPSALTRFAYPFVMDGDLVNEMRLDEDGHKDDPDKSLLNLNDDLATMYGASAIESNGDGRSAPSPHVRSGRRAPTRPQEGRDGAFAGIEG